MVETRADHHGAAGVVARNPFGDDPAIGQLRLFIRRAEFHYRLIQRVMADAGVPIYLGRHAAGEKRQRDGGEQKLPEKVQLHASA